MDMTFIGILLTKLGVEVRQRQMMGLEEKKAADMRGPTRQGVAQPLA